MSNLSSTIKSIRDIMRKDAGVDGEIAEKLGISEHTVHDHHKEINRKVKLSGFGGPLEYGVKMRYITMEQYLNKKKK